MNLRGLYFQQSGYVFCLGLDSEPHSNEEGTGGNRYIGNFIQHLNL
jgi:hypothetical protein